MEDKGRQNPVPKDPGSEKAVPDSPSRRRFLKNLGLGGAVVAGAAAGETFKPFSKLLNIFRPREQVPEIPPIVVNLEKLTPEQLKQISERAWSSMAEVLKDGQFNQGAIRVDKVSVVKNTGRSLSPEDVIIEGSLPGNGQEKTVKFSINYAKGLETAGQGLKLDLQNGGANEDLVLGDRVKESLSLEYYFGQNAGNITRNINSDRSLEVKDPVSMKKRYDDVKEVLKNMLKMPENTGFIPEQDYNGFVTFVDTSPGHGYVAHARYIDGRGVTISISEGLLTNNIPTFQEITSQYRVTSDKLSFNSLLELALYNLKPQSYSNYSPSNVAFRYVPNSPAKEEILELGKKHLPQDQLAKLTQ